MEVQIQELLESIKRDGVEAAERKAAELVANAERKAAKIIEDAKKEADKIILEAEHSAVTFEQSGKAALEQAGRDLLISLHKEITNIFDKVLKSDTAKATTGKPLATLIEKVVLASDLETASQNVDIPEKESKEVIAQLKKSLAEQMAKGLEIRPVKGLDAGFKLSEKSGTSYYDFSAIEISRMISQFLNPMIAELIKKVANEGV